MRRAPGLLASIVTGALLGLAAEMTVAQQQPNGGASCGWIGVQVRPMTAAFAESLGMTEIYGAIFDRPEPGSPAASAHIEAGDVLTAINGSRLVHASDFARIIAATAHHGLSRHLARSPGDAGQIGARLDAVSRLMQ
jgi:S1-C subfamily serine protease